ncbi:hypothetical protein [Pseudonocardia endophytica]|uniref:Uncharacterized protein n=1 Tax=Pseudonocardia endophytica TaxID=401976 RepID=A0A4R1HFZ8_PSEEN|nr:hypothetical protein [Pseudonocardia endophytica]TCK20608.1 hypothetical protein EV378_4569 [Pseudonocardia endophytica]
MTTLPASRRTPTDVVFQHWRHSFEEDADGVEVFRPDDAVLPPAFGRDGFEMFPDGTFVQEDIGPADGIVRTSGRWHGRGARRVTVRFDGRRPDYAFEVLEVDETILRRRVDAAAAPVHYLGAEPADAATETFAQQPPASSSRLVDFNGAVIITLRSFPPQFVLRVDGTVPYESVQVELVPLVYVQRPDYWGIEVVGTMRGPCVAGTTPYLATLPLARTTGTLGIDVIGATRTERIDLGPSDGSADCRDWTAFLDRQPIDPPTLRVRGVCTVPDGTTIELKRHEPPGINPRDLLLDKIVTRGAATTDGTSDVEVVFETPARPGSLDTVTILPDGPTLTVEDVF